MRLSSPLLPILLSIGTVTFADAGPETVESLTPVDYEIYRVVLDNVWSVGSRVEGEAFALSSEVGFGTLRPSDRRDAGDKLARKFLEQQIVVPASLQDDMTRAFSTPLLIDGSKFLTSGAMLFSSPEEARALVGQHGPGLRCVSFTRVAFSANRDCAMVECEENGWSVWVFLENKEASWEVAGKVVGVVCAKPLMREKK